MTILKTLLASGALVVAAGAASAATDNWITGENACEVDDITPNALECAGFFDVTNDVAGDATEGDGKENFVDVNLDSFDGTTGLFGHTDWDFFFKYENATNSGVGYREDGSFMLSDILNSTYGEIAIAFKKGAQNDSGFGSEWAAYRYESPFQQMGSYTLARFTNDGLFSHMSIWGRGEPDICEGDDCGGGHTPIPLPAAGWLLLGGLGGLAAMRRRNKV